MYAACGGGMENFMSNYNKERLTYPSSDGKHTSVAYLFTPAEGEVRAVVQLCHGMCEYILRYEPFAAYLCENGVAFAGNDHLGHGETAASDEDLGFTVDKEYLVDDVKTLTDLLKSRFPDKPFIFSGHSMGSFIARAYLARYSEIPDGAVIIGTGGPDAPAGAGLAMARMVRRLKGAHYRSKMIKKLAFGSYNKRIQNPASPNAWISRDEAVVKKYDADKFCTFSFTAQGYCDLFGLLKFVSSREWATTLCRDLPVLLLAGEEDPVGSYGKGVRLVYERLKEAGMEDVTLKLYPEDRHEVLNEPDRAVVYADFLAFVNRVAEKKAEHADG